MNYAFTFSVVLMLDVWGLTNNTGETVLSRATQFLETVNNSPASLPYTCNEAILSPHLQHHFSGVLTLRATIYLP